MDIKKIITETRGVGKGKITPMYIYGTEQISNYYSKFNLKNKTVLTIAGSGDQAINAFYYGAKEVTCFDINQLTGYFIDLKTTAIKHLSYIEFLEFFGSPNKIGNFDYKLFIRFSKDLKKDTFDFFNSAYVYFKKDGNKIIRSSLFNERSMLLVTLFEMNAYLKTEANYNRCKEILKTKKINFICEDIFNLSKKLKEKFDVLNISNIPNYFCSRFEYDSEEYKGVFVDLLKLVKKKGILFFYVFSLSTYPNDIAKKTPPFAINKNLVRFCKQFGLPYKIIKFSGNGKYKNNKKIKNTFDKIAVLEK